jgi:hypothetical protein
MNSRVYRNIVAENDDDSTPTQPQAQKQSFLDEFIRRSEYMKVSQNDQFDRYIRAVPIELADDSITSRNMIYWWSHYEFHQPPLNGLRHPICSCDVLRGKTLLQFR